MKVLFVNNASGWGGAQESLLDLGSALRRQGVEAHFVARRGSRSESRLRELGAPVYGLPGHGLGDAVALVRLAALLRARRFDLVSIEREHDLLLTALARRAAFPMGSAVRLVIRFQHPTTRIQPLLGSLDAIVCVSGYVRARLLERYPALSRKVAVLHYGVAVGHAPPPSKLDPHRPRRVFTDRGFPLIGMVGDLWKNQEELIEAVPLVKGAFPRVTVAIVGGRRGDPRFAEMERLVAARGLEREVILTGHLPRERMADVFYDLDLAVSTHRHEGFGLVHVESLAAGTPVVAYRAGGLVDIVDGRGVGALVEGGPAEFAAAVVGLLGDDAARAAMGAAGYALARQTFSLEAMAARYLEFYRRVVDGLPAGHPAGTAS